MRSRDHPSLFKNTFDIRYQQAMSPKLEDMASEWNQQVSQAMGSLKSFYRNSRNGPQSEIF